MAASLAVKPVMKVAVMSVWAVALRPRLWPAAMAALARFAPDGWWRRPPFLPVPTAALARFRSEAMYGDPAVGPRAADIVVWLRWCRAQSRGPT